MPAAPSASARATAADAGAVGRPTRSTTSPAVNSAFMPARSGTGADSPQRRAASAAAGSGIGERADRRVRGKRIMVWQHPRLGTMQNRARRTTARVPARSRHPSTSTTHTRASSPHPRRDATAGARRACGVHWSQDCGRPSRGLRHREPRRARAGHRRAAAGSWRARCGNTRSASPGTKTTVNARPRSMSGAPTNNRPCRWRGGSDGSSRNRSASTSRTSARVTGPTSPIGRRSASVDKMRSGRATTRGAMAVNRSSQSPQALRAGQPASSSTSGRANARRAASASRSRAIAVRRGPSGSSASSSFKRNCRSEPRPSRRRDQRSRPPMTSAPFSSRSQRHGEGSARLDVTAESSVSGAGGGFTGSPAASAAGASISSPGGIHEEDEDSADVEGCGSGASETYSAKRLADSPSTTVVSSMRNARPVGSGRLVPRANHAGMPAR